MAKKSDIKKRVTRKTLAKAPATKKPLPRKSVTKKAKPILSKDPLENGWTGLFVLAEHWQSDLKFFEDESRFLSNLMDKYFMWLIEEQNIESTRVMAEKLLKLEKRRFALDQKVAEHLRHLSNLVQNPFSHDAQVCRDEHGALEVALADFLKDFRQIKKEIFLLTELVIESEKAKHLLGR